VLGLRRRSAGDGYVLFDLAGIDVVLEAVQSDDKEGRDLVGRFLGVSLRVDDVEAACHRLRERGAIVVQPPEKQAWSGTLAFIRDPDENVLTLVS
jgi:lactoylglutathione lyase